MDWSQTHAMLPIWPLVQWHCQVTFMQWVVQMEDEAPWTLLSALNPNTNEWSMVAPLKHCRGGVSVAVHCGKIFAMNGMNEYMSIVDSTECYNEIQDKWNSPTACTHTARFSAAAIVLPPLSFPCMWKTYITMDLCVMSNGDLMASENHAWNH